MCAYLNMCTRKNEYGYKIKMAVETAAWTLSFYHKDGKIFLFFKLKDPKISNSSLMQV